ncbi:hypothetical protein GF371_00235 [Candidatus Woesearchaeota archaeon]|nr:hypothetical protein [Candidatus Woesearchaeota archaeon]
MGLEHILVADEQFISTYPTGLKDFQDWECARDLFDRRKSSRRRKDGTITAIAKTLGRSCQTVYQWLVKGNKPPALKYLAQARRIGLMPFGLDNEKFLYINKFFAYVFWTGSIGRKYQIGVNLPRKPGKSLNNMLNKKLRINSTYREESSCIACNRNGPFYGRVFHQLGLPVGGGRKAGQFFEMPVYVRRLVEIMKDEDGQKKYRTTARAALEDFMLILLKTRKHVSNSSNYWSVALHCNKNKKIAEKLGEDVIRIFRALFPRSGITKRNLGNKPLYHKKRKNWNSRIYLRQENLQRLEKYYPEFYRRIDDNRV